MFDRYEPESFEAQWRQRWEEADLFRTREEEGRPKFYGLDFFPYPSGAGLSVGHCRNYIPTDVICRMKYMQGYNVLHPMGFDAFGLPAENEAIKRKSHPAPMIERYAETYRRQMNLIGISYDWSRSFASCDASYYRWTQWIFKQLYERGLAYRKMAAVNWDPVDKTVLADEEVIAGRAERSGALVEKKYIPQWFFKITDYAQQLLDDLDDIDWPEGIKAMQRNWIGRSEGVQFRMKLQVEAEAAGDPENLEVKEAAPTFEVFTTRIDTIFGMTFCVLAPEHPLVDIIAKSANDEYAWKIRDYRESASRLSDADRQATTREKTGVFTGAHAINPATGQPVPVFIADYVLMNYGTGAIMAVPGHDERDYEFAQKYGIPIPAVIAPEPGHTDVALPFAAKDGFLINSRDYDGLSVVEAQAKLGEWIEALGLGERKVNYKLRDWLISRQRYWGCPIPIRYDKDGNPESVPDSELPVELPEVDNYEPSGDGSSPLTRIPEFVNVTTNDGTLGTRETDTMGGFACSSWYFLRFCDPHNEQAAFDPKRVAAWMPVDCYVGGAEHAVMHLLYARFWTKVLHDLGLVPVKEPFARLQNQGQVLAHTPYRSAREGEKLGVGEDGVLVSFDEAKQLPEDQLTWKWARMSKSKGNVVTPDEAVAEYGADALRIYELFVAPFEADIQWSNDGMQGAVRFLSRVFKWVSQMKVVYDANWRNEISLGLPEGKTAAKIRRATHQLIEKVTGDIDRFSFNTAIAAMMTALNTYQDLLKIDPQAPVDTQEQLAWSEAVERFVLLLAPFAPHSADQLWYQLGRDGFTYHVNWPESDPNIARQDEVTIAIQVNGKLRDTLLAELDTPKDVLESRAQASDKVQAHLEGKSIAKVIVVPNKLVNIVAK